MTYSISELSALSGVSVRMLRHYDDEGLLCPPRDANGYRRYGGTELRRLQQILFYREMEFPLEAIRRFLSAPDYDAVEALTAQRAHLVEKRARMDRLIDNVDKALMELKGEYKMSDFERFEDFKKDLVEQNEAQYGKEVREKYGDEAVDQSNRRLMGLSEADYARQEELQKQIAQTLRTALQTNGPSGTEAQRAVALHREWLAYFGDYPDEAYLGLCDMYVDDPRFTVFYDNASGEGAARLLRDAAYAALLGERAF